MDTEDPPDNCNPTLTGALRTIDSKKIGEDWMCEFRWRWYEEWARVVGLSVSCRCKAYRENSNEERLASKIHGRGLGGGESIQDVALKSLLRMTRTAKEENREMMHSESIGRSFVCTKFTSIF